MNKQEFKKLDREQMIIAFNQLKDDYTNLFNKSVSKDKIRDMQRYREFELQQEYKDFENDVEWKTYNKILEEN